MGVGSTIGGMMSDLGHTGEGWIPGKKRVPDWGNGDWRQNEEKKQILRLTTPELHSADEGLSAGALRESVAPDDGRVNPMESKALFRSF